MDTRRLCGAALAGTGAYFFFRHLDTSKIAEADALKQFDVIRARFGSRPPLVEIVKPLAADIRINRLVDPAGRRVTTIHVLNWNADEGARMESDLPLWLMRFSSVNLLSQLGIAPERFRLTIDDIQRYGPGIVVDYRVPGRVDVLVWVE